jgi:hypothetical protein
VGSVPGLAVVAQEIAAVPAHYPQAAAAVAPDAPGTLPRHGRLQHPDAAGLEIAKEPHVRDGRPEPWLAAGDAVARDPYREDGKVKNRTLTNLSKWKPEEIAALRSVLRDERLLPVGDGFEILRSLPHDHIAAVLGMTRRLGLDPRLKAAALMPPGAPRTRVLALALIVARLIDPAAKLATARRLDERTASHSLGAVLGLGAVAVNELYAALNWLVAQQPKIETKLARRHLGEGSLILYDVTSSYLEGCCCPLAQFGYSRDGKANKLQIVFGVLCTRDGCPIAVEVFTGNTADPSTLKAQADKLRQHFGLRRVVLVGDRGMITQAHISQKP